MYLGIKKDGTTYLVEITNIKEYIRFRDVTKDKIFLLPDNEVEKLKNSNENIIILGR